MCLSRVLVPFTGEMSHQRHFTTEPSKGGASGSYPVGDATHCAVRKPMPQKVSIRKTGSLAGACEVSTQETGSKSLSSCNVSPALSTDKT